MDGAVPRQFGKTAAQFVHRNVDGMGNVAGGVLLW